MIDGDLLFFKDVTIGSELIAGIQLANIVGVPGTLERFRGAENIQVFFKGTHTERTTGSTRMFDVSLLAQDSAGTISRPIEVLINKDVPVEKLGTEWYISFNMPLPAQLGTILSIQFGVYVSFDHATAGLIWTGQEAN